ncbi:GAF domain-containing protein [Exilibacterium tricleocarpae]|uniref:histidine kinase n=1 Tax=Exilibacterium tricleocarpae TaxID=2591008 RepID=A0A545SMW6_9GAMM|nr:ATP-binding protein [Exilibacterium tricleocarpae]TQV66305.1 GAF domain-containing protein [Exilibacterium tricleocarpae]
MPTDSDSIQAQAGVTLDNCAEEPIHIPGLIQPHGYLLALTPEQLTVRHASRNAAVLFGMEFDQLLGKSLAELFDDELFKTLSHHATNHTLHKINPTQVVLGEGEHKKYFDVIVSDSQQYIIMDMEASDPHIGVFFEAQYHRTQNFLNTVINLQSINEIFDYVAEEVREITGFDRVMVYQFDKDYNGEVIAEAKKAELNSFLKQHFPESDIPAQARALYLKNRLRLLVDTDAEPVPLHPNDEDVDLGSSTLRSVSPIHRQYLRNMGVCASMSISITVGNRLWGLIACHHYGPHLVPFRVRENAAYLGLTLSHLVAVRSREQRSLLEARAQTMLASVTECLSQEQHFLEGLRKAADKTIALFNASGMAWRLNGEIDTFGDTPAQSDIEKVFTWFHSRIEISDTIFHSDQLSAEDPVFDTLSEYASGVLILPISVKEQHYIIWFRRELIQTKNWGGKPEKVIEFVDDGSHRLMPRSSFKLWQEQVRNKSLPWSDVETISALKLRNIVINYVLLHSEKLKEINQTLEQKVRERTTELEEQMAVRKKAQRALKRALSEAEASNQQLEQFAYVASHDLQEPLRKIQSFGSRIQTLVESYDDPTLKNYLDRMIAAANRMQLLIKDLLSFSRINRATKSLETFELASLVNEVVSDLNVLVQEKRAEISVRDLSAIRADRSQVYRLLQNLIQNSLKFSREGVTPKVEISIAEETGRYRIYKIVDNGIGFEQQYSDQIFELFQRLHGRREYEGTGLGLAICKKIMARHGGAIWAESLPGEGTTVFLKFKL